MVTAPPRDAAGADDGERQRAAVLVVDGDAEPAQALRGPRPSGAVRACGSPSKTHRPVGQRGDRRHEAHHGAGQAAVDGRAAVQRPGRDLPVVAGGVDVGAERGAARRPSARCRASAAPAGRRSGRRRARRARAPGWSATSSRAAETVASHRAGRRAGPARGRVGASWVIAPERIAAPRRGQEVDALGGQPGLAPWPRGGGAWPRACARPTACLARQATPGLPSVSTAAISSPPSIETFLKKWICWLAAGVCVLLLPEPVAGAAWWGPARRRATSADSRGARPVASARPRDDLRGAVDPDQRASSSVGTATLGATLLRRRRACR